MGIKEIQKLKCQDEFLTVSKVYRTANLAHLATFFELTLKIYHSSFLIFEIPSSSNPGPRLLRFLGLAKIRMNQISST